MNLLCAIMLFGGIFFFIVGAIGILRFPDFYARLHPAGKLDSMGLLLSLGGLALYTADDFSLGALLVSLKIVLIVVFVFITSPTATHSIMDAGMRAGLRPWTQKSSPR